MAALIYPASLPCPAALRSTPSERRQTSDSQRPREARALQRDRNSIEAVTWPPLTSAQWQTLRDWWRDDLTFGGSWFAASWPSPRGSVVQVRKFLGAPRRTFMPGGFWRVTATIEVRGASEEPVTTSSVLDADAMYEQTLLIANFAVDGYDASPFHVVPIVTNVAFDDGSALVRDTNAALSNIAWHGVHHGWESAVGRTFEVFVRGNAMSDSRRHIFSLPTGDTPEGLSVHFAGVDFAVGLRDTIADGGGVGVGGTVVVEVANPAPGEFIHVALYVEPGDSTTGHLYLNGIEVGSGPLGLSHRDTGVVYLGTTVGQSSLVSPRSYDVQAFRITRGQRYPSAPFTPPTLPFPEH